MSYKVTIRSGTIKYSNRSMILPSRLNYDRNPNYKDSTYKLKKIKRIYKYIIREIDCTYNIKHFMTISLDIYSDNYSEIRDDPDVIKNYLSKFKKILFKKFPNGWFLYKIEWSPKSGFHVHFICNFGKKLNKTIKTNIKSLWNNIINSKSDVTLDIREYDKKHSSYLTQKAKYKYDGTAICLLKNHRMVGILQKKNMRQKPSVTINVDRLLMFCIRYFINYYWKKKKDINNKYIYALFCSRTENFGGTIGEDIINRALPKAEKIYKKLIKYIGTNVSNISKEDIIQYSSFFPNSRILKYIKFNIDY